MADSSRFHKDRRAGASGFVGLFVVAVFAMPALLLGMNAVLAQNAANPKDAAKDEALKKQVGKLLKTLFSAEDEAPAEQPITTPLTDQATLRRLNEAQRLITEERSARAVGLLQRILDEPEDSFVPPKKPKPATQGGDQWISARKEAERVVGQLGADGLTEYRKLFEDQAAAMLRQAVAENRTDLLVDVARRFFLTESGFQAVNILASRELDRGHPRISLAFLDQLLESPVHRDQVTDAMRAKRALALMLLGRSADAEFALKAIGLPKLQLGGEARPLDKLLANVPVKRTPVKRVEPPSGEKDDSLPLLDAEWSRPISKYSETGRAVSIVLEANTSKQRPTILEFEPIYENDRIYFRDFTGVAAIDANSGATIWRQSDPDCLDVQIENYNADRSANGAGPTVIESAFLANTVYGTLSSDRDRIYYVDQIYADPNMSFVRVNAANDEASSFRGRNRLVALDRETGKPTWTAGGRPTRGAPKSLLSEMFFFGPPMPAGQILYAIGEARSEIRIVAMEAATGALKWSQVLAVPEQRIDTDSFRRSQACRIVQSDGILICPTNLHRVVAFEPLTRTILWTATNEEDALQKSRQHQTLDSMPSVSTFAADPPIIADGRVLISSSMGSRIRCFDLQSGSVLWASDRSGEQFVAGIHDGHVILVGGDHLLSRNLRDGFQEWRQPIPLPSGRGVRIGNSYVQPLSDGRVIAFDLATGETIAQVNDRDRESAGSLYLAGSRVLSVSCGRIADTEDIAGLRAYPLLAEVREEVRRRLADNPRDPRGLYRRARLRLAKGEPIAAIDDLRLALQATEKSSAGLPESAPARRLLFDIAANEALKDLNHVGAFVDELTRLATDDEERGIVDRLLAQYRLRHGDLAGALEAADHHAQLVLKKPIVGEGGIVQREPPAWTRWFLRELLANAKPEERAKVLETLNRRLVAASEKEDIVDLTQLASRFAGSPFGRRADMALGAGLFSKKEYSLAEDAFLAASEAEDRRLSRDAFVSLATVCEQAGQPADARAYLTQLVDRFPTQTFEDGKTAQQTLDDFVVASRQAGRELVRRPDWGNFSQARISFARRDNDNDQRRFRFPKNAAIPFFEQRLLRTSNTRIDVLDRMTGLKEWSTSLADHMAADSEDQKHAVFYHLGHLFFLARGDFIHGMSALDRKQIWLRRARPGERPVEANGAKNEDWHGGSGNGTVEISAVGPGFLAVKTEKDLLVIDPRTGRDLWARLELRSDAEIFGDSDYLFVVQPDGSYTAHRTLDGQVVRSGQFPGSYRHGRHKNFGRKMLIIEQDIRKVSVYLWDAWDEREVWRCEFKARTRNYMSTESRGDDRYLVLVEPETSGSSGNGPIGKVTLLDLRNGSAALQAPLGCSLNDLSRIDFFKDESRFYIATEKVGTHLRYSHITPSIHYVNINGPLRAYDRASQQMLWEINMPNRSLLADPGAELPVLVALESKTIDKQGRISTRTEVYDKRTGKQLDAKENAKYLGFTEMSYDATKRTIDLGSWNVNVHIDLVDEANANANLFRGMLGRMGAIIDGSAKPPEKKEDD